MTNVNEIYKCNICGNIVEVISAGAGELTCCGQAMELLEATQKEEGGAKHIPVITKEDGKIVVTMGEVEHPMLEEHHIVFVELKVGDNTYRANLTLGEKPQAIFDIDCDVEDVKAIEYCNLHGLWHS